MLNDTMVHDGKDTPARWSPQELSELNLVNFCVSDDRVYSTVSADGLIPFFCPFHLNENL